MVDWSTSASKWIVTRTLTCIGPTTHNSPTYDQTSIHPVLWWFNAGTEPMSSHQLHTGWQESAELEQRSCFKAGENGSFWEMEITNLLVVGLSTAIFTTAGATYVRLEQSTPNAIMPHLLTCTRTYWNCCCRNRTGCLPPEGTERRC